MEFTRVFEYLTSKPPFPWQVALYDRLVAGESIRSLDIPTGLGKTSVIAIWLLARTTGAKLPRRLVYVVNRRTVVDQTTTEVEQLRERLHNDPELQVVLESLGPLAISTLRGQFADNGEWSVDPAQHAVICGTVDMIGSRLLFGGYRIGYKSRPLHAGFLGQDALLVHDEAHLEPAFQRLVEGIEREQQRDSQVELPWPKLQVMALSATGRIAEGQIDKTPRPFSLTAEELQPVEIPDSPRQPIHHVWQRITAAKALTLHECEDDKNSVVDMVVNVALSHKDSGDAVVVFVRSVEHAGKILSHLQKVTPNVIPLTGTMRGLERDDLAKNLTFGRFLPTDVENATSGTVYLVCTSAGEVGVNISADHMVCDLATFDSMAQRLGRVNRFGKRPDTQVDCIYPTAFDAKLPNPQREKTLLLLRQLNGDASPLALGKLPTDDRIAAFAPEPTILPATDILFDAWSLTSIREPMPGRPPLQPYLHGITEWEPPQTAIAWRDDVDVISGHLLNYYAPADLLEDYPLKPHELLKDTSQRVFKTLESIAKRMPDSPGWLVSDDGTVELLSIAELADKSKKQLIEHKTILLSPKVGGLTGGMLNGAAKADAGLSYDIADEWKDEEREPRRARVWDDIPPPKRMALIRTIDTKPDSGALSGDIDGNEDGSETGPPERRYWHWYVRPLDAENVTRASARPIRWAHHTKDVVDRIRAIVSSLNLPEELQETFILAAELHDLGKCRELWQRGIGNPNPVAGNWYAKPGKPKNERPWTPRLFSTYRHEFGSVLDIVLNRNHEFGSRFEELSDDMKDLLLHVVAAHHGRARPHFPPEESFDPAPESDQSAREQVIETPRRFARLQQRYGRWGLAYLESLLRAADWAASADPSEAGENA